MTLFSHSRSKSIWRVSQFSSQVGSGSLDCTVSLGNIDSLTCRLVGCSACAVRLAEAMSTPILENAARAWSPKVPMARFMYCR